MDFENKFIYLKKTITNLEKKEEKDRKSGKKKKAKRGRRHGLETCMLAQLMRWSGWLAVDYC